MFSAFDSICDKIIFIFIRVASFVQSCYVSAQQTSKQMTKAKKINFTSGTIENLNPAKVMFFLCECNVSEKEELMIRRLIECHNKISSYFNWLNVYRHHITFGCLAEIGACSQKSVQLKFEWKSNRAACYVTY